jgi:hypothetical protein
MKEQKLIAETDIVEWRSKVNEHLSDGWAIVPQTLSTSVACSRNKYGTTSQLQAYAVVVERDAPKQAE